MSGTNTPADPHALPVLNAQFLVEKRQLELLGYGTGASAFTIVPGAPVSFDARADTRATLFYIWFENLLADGAVGMIRAIDPSWQCRSFRDADGRTYLAIASTVERTFDAVNGFGIALADVGLEKENTRASLLVQHCHLLPDSKPDAAHMEQLACSFIDHSSKTLDLLVGFDSGNVLVADGRASTLRLRITNPSADRLTIYDQARGKVAGLDLELQVLACSPARSKLQDTSINMQGVSVALASSPGGNWSVSTPSGSGDNARWTIAAAPSEDLMGAVLSSGESGSVTLDIGNLVASRPGIGYAILRYRNVPGYGSGQFIAPFTVVEPVAIERFAIVRPEDSGAVPPGRTNVTLEYSTLNADRIAIQNIVTNEIQVVAKAKGTASFDVEASTTFFLTASNLYGHTAMRACHLEMLAPAVRVTRFDIVAPPKGIAHGPVQEVTLAYATSGADTIAIEATATGEVRNPAAPEGKVSFPVDRPSAFVITARSAKGQVDVRSCQLHMPYEMATGMIVMWSGAADAVPAGWALCDGSNGTPDLVSKFIRGAGPAGDAPGSTGGTDDHTHAARAGISVQWGGQHSHGMPAGWYANTASSGKGTAIVDRRGTRDPWQTADAGGHSHEATASITVDAASNLPPWYALCFIMKVN